MRKESWSIGLSCALGAFVGSLISLELAAFFSYGQYLWFVGALIGGSVAYITHEFRTVRRSVAQTWSDMTSWRPNRLRWYLRFLLARNVSAIGSGLVFWLALFAGGLASIGQTAEPGEISIFTTLLIVALVFSTVVALMVAVAFIIGTSGWPTKVLVHEERRARWGAWRYNVFSLPFFGTWYLLRRLVYLLKHVPGAVVFSYRFVKRVLRIIHSSERVLCFVHAAIGASVGYFAGSALIGAFVGALLGVASYELLSVRILKLVPRR